MNINKKLTSREISIFFRILGFFLVIIFSPLILLILVFASDSPWSSIFIEGFIAVITSLFILWIIRTVKLIKNQTEPEIKDKERIPKIKKDLKVFIIITILVTILMLTLF